MQLSNCCPKIPTTKIVPSRCDWLGYQAQIHGGFRRIPCFNNTFFPSPQLNALARANVRRVPVSCDPHLLPQRSPRQDPPSTPIPSGCPMFRCVDSSGFTAIRELTWVLPLGSSTDGPLAYHAAPKTGLDTCTSNLTSVLQLAREKRQVPITLPSNHRLVCWPQRFGDRGSVKVRDLRRFIRDLLDCAQQVRCGIQSAANAGIGICAKVQTDGVSPTPHAVSHLTPYAHSSHLRPYDRYLAWINWSSRRGVRL